jgi:glycyl-tRNA synthetase alpha subunit
MNRKRSPKASTSDEDIPAIHAPSSVNHSQYNFEDTNQGSFLQRHAKKLQEQVNSFLTDYKLNTPKNVILPKCSTLMLLRYAHEGIEDTVL